MMSLVRSFILMVLFATNGAAQTSPLDLLLQQQSQGLPFGTDMQSLEDIFSGQGFDINPENEARTAKEPVIPSEQNVKLLDRRLTAEEAQQRRQQGQALSNDLLGGQSKTQMPSMVETYYKILTGESLDVFGTGKSATSNNIADDPADELLFFNSLGSDYRLAAGDVLAISIRGLSSTDEEAIVDGEGKIAIPGMLPVIAAGRSIADVQSNLKQILEVDDASASVYVSLAAARLVSVQITGAVGVPGTVAVPAYTPVSRVLPLVGDILPQGSARNILLFQNGDRQTVDLYQSLLGIDAADDPLVIHNARLHVGDAFAVERVAAQVRVGAVVVQARGVLQLLKHRGRALRREAGLRHHAEAHAVGLALHVAREIQLVLHERRLAAQDHRLARVAAAAALARGDHAEDQAREHQRKLLVLLVHHAGDVPLRDVRQLVPEHRGEFVAAAYRRHQP